MIDRVFTSAERCGTGLIVLVGLLFAGACTASSIVRPKPSGRVVPFELLRSWSTR